MLKVSMCKIVPLLVKYLTILRYNLKRLAVVSTKGCWMRTISEDQKVGIIWDIRISFALHMKISKFRILHDVMTARLPCGVRSIFLRMALIPL